MSINTSQNRIVKFIRYKIYIAVLRSLRLYAKDNRNKKIKLIIHSLHKTFFLFQKNQPLGWKEHYPEHNIVVQQKIVQQIAYLKFPSIFRFFERNKIKFIYFLSSSWRRKLQDMNVSVNNFLSALLYAVYLLIFFYEGFLHFFRIVSIYFQHRKKNYNKKNRNFDNLAIFCNMTKFKSGVDAGSNNPYTFYNWYLKNIDSNVIPVFVRRKSKHFIEINKNYLVVDSPLLIHILNLNIFLFFFQFVKILLFTLIDIMRLNFSNLILFDQLIDAEIVKNSKYQNKIKFYYIWTLNISRPLWTYEVQKKGSTVSILSLSLLNEMRLRKDLDYEIDHEGYHLSTWCHWYVWSKYCKIFLNDRLSNNPKIDVIGVIYSSDNLIKINFQSKKIISLFTYEAHKFAFGISTMSDWEQLNPNLVYDFYNNILEIVENLDVYVAIKRKSDLPKGYDKKKDITFFEKLKHNKKVIVIDPSTSAYRLISNSNMIISLPFTSTGYAASFLNKPSVYYDPTSTLFREDPSASGVELINQNFLLSQWIIKHLN